MITAVFPGTFDPATLGHLNLIERASKKVDRLIVLVVYNSAKKTLFSADERVVQLNRITSHLENVQITKSNSLTAEFAKLSNAGILIRGLRSGSDFDYELQIAEVNRQIAPGLETMFMPASPKYSYLSSSIVREIFSYGGNVNNMVHPFIAEQLVSNRERFTVQ